MATAHVVDASLPTPFVELGDDVARRFGRHPIKAAATVAAAGYAVMLSVMVAVGLLLTHVIAHSSLGAWDLDATRWLSHHRTGAVNAVTEILSRSADTLGIIGLTLVVALVLGRARRWTDVALVVGGLGLELATFLLVNLIVDRPRPAVVKLGSVPTTSSYPSGHTAAAVVLYGSVALFVCASTRGRWLHWLAIAAAVVLPIAVATARVYRGMHHPLDVLCGALMGLMALAVACAAVGAYERSRQQDEL